MAWQVPRISRALEDKTAALNKPWRILDIESLEAQRGAELSKRRKQGQARSRSSGNKEWLSLFGALEKGGASNAARTKSMRAQYGRFMQIVSELASDGARVEEQHAVGLFVFRRLQSRAAHTEPARKKEIEAVLGPITKPRFREIKQLVDDLDKNWVQEVLGEAETRGRGSTASKNEPVPPKVTKEFGLQEDFVSPFLVEQQQQQQQQAQSTVKSPSPGSRPTMGRPIVESNGSVSTGIDWDWLVDKSHECLALMGQATHDDAVAHAQKLQTMLSSTVSEMELQSELFDLIGDFDIISALLQHREQIVYLQPSMPSQTSVPQQHSRGRSAQPLIRVGITVNTQYEKQMDKLRRKQERKQRQGKDTVVNEDMLSAEAIIRSRREVWQAKVGGATDLQAAIANLPPDSGWESSGWGDKIALPVGTSRKWSDCGGYEEVFVPMPRNAPKADTDELVHISELPDYARMVFSNIKTLNRLQSRVFETAFYSNENMLVCAPTGAGKTNVAMLTILREIGNHFIGGVLHKEEFKIVYVAPMKALASEVTFKFNQTLSALGVSVKELTGDMQLTKREIQDTQVLVVTPEKWDVVTRKSGDGALTSQVRLLIIDEVHLLHEDRGAVIETLVARTLRQVEASQSMIRIVGLSATLPNYKDVAEFLRVNPKTGLYFFDNSFRPVPLSQYFIGIKEKGHVQRLQKMNEICWLKTKRSVENGDQVLIFVHSRNDTVRTAQTLLAMAQEQGQDFSARDHEQFFVAQKDVSRSRNQEMKELFAAGFGIHHAGMLRQDRLLMERLYGKGMIKVLVCTATLAWGVNLPAHTVIIKGTQIYNPEKGGFVELSMLDVMQCFGRAGRPQFDTSGDGIILTSHDKLNHYLAMLNHGLPIESTLTKSMANHLNAEIVLGTVTNIDEAVSWLGYTYLFVRIKRNPMAYGVGWEEKHADPTLTRWRRDLLDRAARRLRETRMVRYDKPTGQLNATNLGRIASHFYVHVESVETFTDPSSGIKPNMSEASLFNLLSNAKEFENVKVRPEELTEMDRLRKTSCQVVPVKGGVEHPEGKINILLQTYLSQTFIKGFALISDQAYVITSAGRLARALFEIVFRDRGWVTLAMQLLDLNKAIERRVWYIPYAHPLAQFGGVRGITPDILEKLEARGPSASMERLRDMTDDEIGALVFNKRMGPEVARCVRIFPNLEMKVGVQPITRTVLRVELTVVADFQWSDRVHGFSEPWWIWVQDAEVEKVYYTELFVINKLQKDQEHKIFFTIPISDPPPPQYFVYAESDRWMGASAVCEMNFRELLLPQRHAKHTDLLDLNPLPKDALRCPAFESLYRFTHFNAIQTQIFHCMYHTNNNALIGAPTGSGKTNCGELAMLRVFKNYPKTKIVYIAPLKAIVRERMIDWEQRLHKQLGKNVVELTGDSQSDFKMLSRADVIVTTPEKWDGVSRAWATRDYVKQVSCVIMDEIHLLGGDRGPILEVIVSRMRFIASQRKMMIRFVGLSTALANARDLADWLGIETVGLYNFKPSVRPVPLECHIAGYPGKHYCPRMQAMNRPSFLAIMEHSRLQPALVFVSSRRQTRLTALDLISYAEAVDFNSTEENPRPFLHMKQEELDMLLTKVDDKNLKHTLSFGIGLHHAGLNQNDKSMCEELFAFNKIQVLVSTSTLAWGVNLPAHLVVVKGTEFFDAKTKRYVDYPITDVLQMMGRAGRPQFDVQGKAVILVHDIKKEFYKKFVYEPFPVESGLPDQLHNHFCAECVNGTIKSKQDAIDYLTWTYFFRRLVMNPAYYHLHDLSHEGINRHLSNLVDNTLADLEEAQCIEIDDMTGDLEPLTLGRIASYYYLDYTTVMMFANSIADDMTIPDVLSVLCDATEFDDVPVRHNEDKLNAELCAHVRMKDQMELKSMDCPHTKTQLLLQAHFESLPLPISDFYTDAKMVLDQAIRVVQAMVDVSADAGWLTTSLNCMSLIQMVVQARWHDASTLTTLPNIHDDHVAIFDRFGVHCLPELANLVQAQMKHPIPSAEKKKMSRLYRTLSAAGLTKQEIAKSLKICSNLPIINLRWSMETDVYGEDDEATITVSLERINRSHQVIAPCFPKPKTEGHWLVLGCEGQGELLALKRVTIARKTETNLIFYTDDIQPDADGYAELSLYLISDSYIGLDQQYSVPIYIDAENQDNATDGSTNDDAISTEDVDSLAFDNKYGDEFEDTLEYESTL